MYLDFHKFREKPFNLTPDPRFVFLSKNHKEAFAHLIYGIRNRAGFIALTGEVGSGKTTILRTLFSQLDTDHYRTALIFNPCISSGELLKNINREFGITDKNSNDTSPLDPLNRFLLHQNAKGRTVVLAIDEAQDLEIQVLEQIRLISNLETDREKLIQIILTGQPELIQILDKKELRQLDQRITVRYHLQPMDFKDTVGYVNHRLKVAGGNGRETFSKKALKLIYTYSKGLPRLVNAACDRMLLTGYARDTTKINSRIASAGVKDIKKNMAADSIKRRFILISTAVVIAIFFAGSIFLKWDKIARMINPNQQIKAFKAQPAPNSITTGKELNLPQQIETFGNKPIKDSVITGEELFRVMAVKLGEVTEAESAGRAYNCLAGLWNVSPVSENRTWNSPDDIEDAARSEKLRAYRFSGNMGTLLRLDQPVALELTLPDIKGKRFIALLGMENEQVLIKPRIAGRRALSFRELEKYWSGQGFLLWKDFSDVMTKLPSEPEKNRIMRFQKLLKEAGTYHKSLTGTYDKDTLLAVKQFQSSKGIKQDGIAGSQTLMLLYRSIDRFPVPGFTGRHK